MTVGDADAALVELIQRMTDAAGRISLPELPGSEMEAAAMAAKMLDILRARIESFE